MINGDYKFPSLKTKNEKQEEEEKRMEQERIKEEKENGKMDHSPDALSWEAPLKTQMPLTPGQSHGSRTKLISG